MLTIAVRILIGILIICASAFTLFILFCLFKAAKLLKDKPPLKVYQKRSTEADFCTFDQVSESLIHLILSMEDCNFFRHNGIDVLAIKNCFIHNIKSPNKHGASTITQQLCKNLYFTFEASYIRKLIEIIISLRMEKALKKRQIFELYINMIYYDNGQYGIVNATDFYFGKKVSELTFNESFFLLAMLPVVGLYNPLREPEKFCGFRNRKAFFRWRVEDISDEEFRTIMRHTPDCLDEDIQTHKPEEYEKYVIGPMINERFGINSDWEKEIEEEKHKPSRNI